jgi:hypothetical protein
LLCSYAIADTRISSINFPPSSYCYYAFDGVIAI